MKKNLKETGIKRERQQPLPFLLGMDLMAHRLRSHGKTISDYLSPPNHPLPNHLPRISSAKGNGRRVFGYYGSGGDDTPEPMVIPLVMEELAPIQTLSPIIISCLVFG